MTNTKIQTALRRMLVPVSALLLTGAMLVAQQPPPPPQDQPQAQMLAPNQLDTLVAPIALYPDALLSQIMVAATYPLEVAEAGQWLEQHRDLQGPQLTEAARQQNWDPSVQALITFPDVVGRLNADIRWTTDLGNAFLAQQADVMGAVQRMRAQAMAAGKLSSNAQQTVTTEMDEGQQDIEIQPANPEVVYVPSYNPAYIWGPPAWGYYPAWDWGFGYGYGSGIYIGGFYGGLGWGGWGWGCNWRNGFIFERPFFFSHYGFHGFSGGRAWGNNVIWAHNANHRLGVAYPNRSLASRYGGASVASRSLSNGRSGNQAYRPQQSVAGRTNAGQAGGWNRFNGAGSANGAQVNRGYSGATGAYRPTPSTGNYNAGRVAPSNGYRYSPYAGRSNGGYTAPSNRAAPSTGRSYGGGYAAPTYRSAPSAGRSYSAPSYHASPSAGRSNGGSSAAPRSSGGGGSVHSSGGGGGSHGGGGGGGSHGGGHR
jgi:uncharacterized membrane protein YgcG